MSYYRGYDDYDDRGYGGGYGDGYRSSRYDDFRDRDRDRYGGRSDRDRRGGGGGRRDSGYERRSGGYEGRRDDYDRRRDEYGRRREGYGGGGSYGGGGGRREGGKSGWGGGGGGRGGDRKGGFRGRGRGGRENGGRGRGNKRSFSGGGRGGSAKRPRLMNVDNWPKGDRHSIMESHFLETVPENFQEDWLCFACPVGKRSLLVAASNQSQLYTKEGHPDMKFKSSLPNGSPLQSEVMKYHDLTILDSVYCPEKKSVYILDLLHWKHFPYYDTEAEFRTFFLPQKFGLLKNPTKVSENNEFPMIVLEKFPCTASGIEQALKQADYKVEGLMFINKKSTYECTDSPNSLLLRVDKVEKLLGVPVPEGVSFTESGPNDEKWREELEERKKLQAAREEAAREAKEKEAKEKEAKKKEKEAEKEQEADASAEGDAATTEEYATGGDGEYAGGEYTSANEYAAEGEYTTTGEYTTEGEYTAGGEYATEGEYTTGGEYTAEGGEYAAAATTTTTTTTGESYPAGEEYSTGENYTEGWSTGGDSNAYSTTNFYG